MVEELEALAKMEYPGRVIIIGESPEAHDVVLYAITGRSPASQARRLKLNKRYQQIFVKPTDKKLLKKGNPDLLVYPAIYVRWKAIAVSNGKQTRDIKAYFETQAKPVNVLVSALYKWEYEPDSNYTPRISGCAINGAALSIIKRGADGSAVKHYFEVPLIAGKGKMITTYTGVNENPLPSFKGEPLDVGLPWNNVEEAVDAMYDALGPKEGQPDFRVGVAGIYVKDGFASIKVKNRCDLGGE